jgi:phosphonoacetaldehyde hydrolase
MNSSSYPFAAILFDWAGTTVDYGSRAPTQVFLEIFRRRGIEITVAEARGPMGRAKHEHIAEVLQLPRVAQRWREVHQRDARDADVQAMYAEFLPLQREILSAGSHVIPGIVEAVNSLRQCGLKIGSSTGYTRELMAVVAPQAAVEGYAPDVLICSDDVTAGRPAPWMNFLAAERLGVYPMSKVVVVDDTPVGIAAGRNAGAWTIGVSQTGNALGLSKDEVQALPKVELESRLADIEQSYLTAGAHLVIPSVADLPRQLDRLAELAQRP